MLMSVKGSIMVIETRKTTLLAGACAAALLALLAGSAMGQTYHVQNLGSLGGLGDTEAFALGTASGHVLVAGFGTTGTSNHHALVWDRNGVGLVDVPPLAGDQQSSAFGVDASGAVVGVSYTLGQLGVRAFRWQGGVVTTLGNFTPRGVNAAGDVIGSVPLVDADGLQTEHACILPAGAGAPIDLGTLNGSPFSKAFAVNAVQQVVGVSGGPTFGTSRATLWWQGAKIDLGTLGGTRSEAYAINSGSAAVGWSLNAATPPAQHAVRFNLNASGLVTSRDDLGTLPASVPGAGTWSYAYGVNDAGWMVGQSNGLAFVHYGEPGGSIRDLNGLIPSSPAWHIVSARAIDAAGRIAAWGVDGLGAPRALLLLPCDADFDRDGNVDVPDIFAMLNAWFMGDLTADTDRNGMVSTTDVFAFLNAWFAGCSS